MTSHTKVPLSPQATTAVLTALTAMRAKYPHTQAMADSLGVSRGHLQSILRGVRGPGRYVLQLLQKRIPALANVEPGLPPPRKTRRKTQPLVHLKRLEASQNSHAAQRQQLISLVRAQGTRATARQLHVSSTWINRLVSGRDDSQIGPKLSAALAHVSSAQPRPAELPEPRRRGRLYPCLRNGCREQFSTADALSKHRTQDHESRVKTEYHRPGFSRFLIEAEKFSQRYEEMRKENLTLRRRLTAVSKHFKDVMNIATVLEQATDNEGGET